MNISFTKMQGLGNDFVIINAVRETVQLTPELIRQMADRHLGIGFDQLLMLEPPRHEGVDFQYRIFNADGSEVEQCGNGARCIGRFIWESGLTDKKTIVLGTLKGNIEVHEQGEDAVKVNMGIPKFDPKCIPFLATSQATMYSLDLGKEAVRIGVVNLGNPHAVLMVDDVNQAPVQSLGEMIERHPFFPERVNVGFMQCVDRNHISLRVFERGVGETLACGTGACAAVAIGRLWGMLNEQVQVNLLGGELMINWAGDGQPLWMTGPGEIVFLGTWFKRSR